jgi:hypothetical protein
MRILNFFSHTLYPLTPSGPTFFLFVKCKSTWTLLVCARQLPHSPLFLTSFTYTVSVFLYSLSSNDNQHFYPRNISPAFDCIPVPFWLHIFRRGIHWFSWLQKKRFSVKINKRDIAVSRLIKVCEFFFLPSFNVLDWWSPWSRVEYLADPPWRPQSSILNSTGKSSSSTLLFFFIIFLHNKLLFYCKDTVAPWALVHFIQHCYGSVLVSMRDPDPRFWREKVVIFLYQKLQWMLDTFNLLYFLQYGVFKEKDLSRNTSSSCY